MPTVDMVIVADVLYQGDGGENPALTPERS